MENRMPTRSKGQFFATRKYMENPAPMTVRKTKANLLFLGSILPLNYKNVNRCCSDDYRVHYRVSNKVGSFDCLEGIKHYCCYADEKNHRVDVMCFLPLGYEIRC